MSCKRSKEASEARTRARKLMDVRTPSAMKPKKAMDIRVGCHENRVPLKMATGMLTAQPMTRMWMLVTNQRMLLVPAGKHMKALRSR